MNSAKLLGLLAVAYFCPSLRAHARIGETLRECEVRYGSPIYAPPAEHPAEDKRIYKKGDFTIVIWFLHNKAASITFFKTDQSVIAELDCVSLLNANDPGTNALDWDITNHPDSEIWIRLNHSMFAIYDKEKRTFNVRTGEYQTALVAAEEAQRKQKLQGF
jgi:hypothetical protein